VALFSSVGSSTDTSDPNSAAGASQAKLEEDLNRFLNLLVTQLQNQDPLEPLDSNEFTSQLVEFANVEQQISQNAHLEKMLNLQESSQAADMVSYLGTTVEVEGRSFNLTDSEATFTYTMPANAASGSITITNSSGLTVYTADADTTSGTHTFDWNGLDKSGNPLPDGQYNVLVTALDARRELLSVDHTVFGQVTGASAQDGQLSLFMGDIEIPFETILSVQQTEQEQAAAD
jgi:flagellar basal-body rod modification protein FlgD